MTSKGMFESKSGSTERGTTWHNIIDNLNNCKGLAITTQTLRYHFASHINTYKSKTRREVRGSDGVKGFMKMSNF